MTRSAFSLDPVPSDPENHHSMDSSTPVPPGIPDYELLRMIGRGSYGEVWLARGITGLYRAVKIVWRKPFGDGSPFEREFQGLREFAHISLSEPGQLAVLHIGRKDSEGFFYYVMELADDVVHGQEVDPLHYVPHTLRESIAQGAVLPAAECVALGVSLTKALATLHRHGLVHRDVKPSNIVMVHGAPKLADIGLVTAATDGLTFVGTEGFVPPEGPGQPPADIFSLGKVLYELSTGLDRRDFPRLPEDLSARNDRQELLELNEILLKACDPDPGRRYQMATAMHDELLLIQAGKSVRRLRMAEQGLRRAARWAATFAVLAVVGLTGALVERQRADEAERLVRYSAVLSQVRDAVEREDYGFARRSMQEQNVSRLFDEGKGLEWRAMHHLARGDPAEIWRAEGPSITRLDATPDGSAVAVHDNSGHLSLLDAITGETIERIAGMAAFAGITPDGEWYLGTNPHLELSRWPVRGDGAERPGETSVGPARVLGATDEGEVVALALDPPHRMIVWAPERGLEIHPLGAPPDAHWEFFRGAVRGDGTVALAWVSLHESRARFRLSHWRADTGLNSTECDERPSTVGVDDEGPWAIGDLSGREWRPDATGTFRPSGRIFPAETAVRRKSPSGEWLVGHSNLLSWFSDAPWGNLRNARGHESRIQAILALEGGQTVLSATVSGELRRWSVNDLGHSARTFQARDSHSLGTDLTFLADGTLAVSGTDGATVVLSPRTLTPLGRIESLRSPVAQRSHHLIGLAAEGVARVDLRNHALIQKSGDDLVLRATVAMDSGHCFLIDAQGRLSSVDPEGRLRFLENGWRDRFRIRTNAAGTLIWSTGTDQSLTCWRVSDRREVWRVQLPTIAPSFVHSERSDRLFLILQDGRIQVRSALTGDILHQTSAASASPEAIALTPIEDRLLVAGRAGGIDVFTADPPRYLCTLPLPRPDAVYQLACDTAGDSIATLGRTGLVQALRTSAD